MMTGYMLSQWILCWLPGIKAERRPCLSIISQYPVCLFRLWQRIGGLCSPGHGLGGDKTGRALMEDGPYTLSPIQSWISKPKRILQTPLVDGKNVKEATARVRRLPLVLSSFTVLKPDRALSQLCRVVLTWQTLQNFQLSLCFIGRNTSFEYLLHTMCFEMQCIFCFFCKILKFLKGVKYHWV